MKESSHAETIARLRCFRGIDTLSAAGLCAEIGDFRRFAKPTQLAGYLGITPSERTSDEKRRQGQITKAGSKHARRLLVEAAHHYARKPVVGTTLRRRQEGQDPASARSPGGPSGGFICGGRTCGTRGASPPARRRSPARASSPALPGRPRCWATAPMPRERRGVLDEDRVSGPARGWGLTNGAPYQRPEPVALFQWPRATNPTSPTCAASRCGARRTLL